MEEIVKVIVYSLCGIITAAAGLVITYLNKKAKRLEEQKKKHEDKVEKLTTEIRVINNGFKEKVYHELVEIKKELEEVKKGIK